MSSSSPYKVIVAQVEYIRNNTYFPDTSAANGTVTIIDGSTSSHAVCPGFSDHATQVFNRLIAGYAQGLIGTVIPIEAVSFMYPRTQYGLNAGRTLDPNAPAWDMENHSWGGSDPLWENDSPLTSTTWNSTLWGATLNYIPGILSRQAKRIEKYNIISLIALPDPGMPATRLLAAAQSRNIIKVGSAHGEVTTAEYTPDVIFEDAQADYTSYDDPDVGQTVAVMISYLKTNNINYNAGDVAQIVKDVAKGNNLYHNHAQCISQLQLHYPITVLSPDPTPVVTTSPVVVITPTPAPDPTPVQPTPIVVTPAAPIITPSTNPVVVTTPTTPTTPVITTPISVSTPTQPTNPTPVSTSSNIPAPIINNFWHDSGWSPCHFSYQTTGAVSAYAIDPWGQKVNIPVNGSFTASLDSKGSINWQFVFTGPDGQITTHTEQLHCVFSAADIAALSPVAVTTPVPSAPVVAPIPVPVVAAPTPVPVVPVDPLIAIASNLGVNYDAAAQTFASLTATQVKQVALALQQAGL